MDNVYYKSISIVIIFYFGANCILSNEGLNRIWMWPHVPGDLAKQGKRTSGTLYFSFIQEDLSMLIDVVLGDFIFKIVTPDML